MAYRVTTAEVKEIMEEEVDENRLTPFINTANLVINTSVAPSYIDEDELLKEMERYYTAHLASSAIYRPYIKAKVMDLEESYSDIYKTGLDATPYGQQLRLIDYKDIFKGLGKNKIIFKSINYLPQGI